jgi:histone H2A
MATPKKSSQKKRAAAKKSGSNSAIPSGRIVSKSSGVYLAAVLSYLTAEVLELSSKSLKAGSSRITPRAVTLAVRADGELSSLLKDVTLSRGGVVAKVDDALTKNKKASKKGGKKAKKSAKKAAKKTGKK